MIRSRGNALQTIRRPSAGYTAGRFLLRFMLDPHPMICRAIALDRNCALYLLVGVCPFFRFSIDYLACFLVQARRAHRKAFLFYWDPLKKEFIETFLGIKMIKTFSVMVIELVNWKANLQNEKDGTSESPHRLVQIEHTINAIDSRLRYLQAVAKAFKV